METREIFLQNRPEPALHQRVSAALFIAAFGVDCGISTKYDLMWPYAVWEDHDDMLKRVAAKLLASVHTAVLEALPPLQTEQISKALAAYLSLSCGDGSLDDSFLSEEFATRRLG